MRRDQLAFSTNAFKQTTVREAVDAIASIGYAGVEIMADAPHMRADTFTDEAARELARVIGDRGLRVSNVNAFTGFCLPDGDTYHPTWVEDDAALRQRRVDYTRRAIELTAIIGGDRVSIQPGGPCQGCDVEALADRYAAGIAACLDVARDAGVTIGIEPEPGLLIETVAQFASFKARCFADEPMVVMNCDVGHHYCVREDPAEVLVMYRDVIGHVHIEDIAASRVHQHLVPGDGAMDYPSIFDALDSIGYDGMLTVELYPYVDTAADVAQRAYDALGRYLTG